MSEYAVLLANLCRMSDGEVDDHTLCHEAWEVILELEAENKSLKQKWASDAALLHGAVQIITKYGHGSADLIAATKRVFAVMSAATELETLLSENVGINEEWPVEILGDESHSETLAQLLTQLKHAIGKTL